MELASPFPEEHITQIDAEVPLEPLSLQADNTDLELDLHSYERPLAVSPCGTIEHVPDWNDTHEMSLEARSHAQLGTFQGLGRNSPSQEQVVRRITRDLHTHLFIESLDCELNPKATLHHRCLLDVGTTPRPQEILRLASRTAFIL